MTTVYTAELPIPVGAGAIWAVLVDPAQHTRLDDSGTVGTAVTEDLLSHTGQVFTMNMSWDDGAEVTRYQSDNHVTVFVPQRSIAWMTALVGGPPLGWSWRYDLTPIDGGTEVTLIYDWTGTSEENIERFGVPNRTPEQLQATLLRLARLVAR